MFASVYLHKLTPKNQVALPSKLRDQIKELGSDHRLNLAHWRPECVYLYTDRQIDDILERIREDRKDEDLIRDLSSKVCSVDLDGQGRFVIPSHVVKQYGLEGEVVFWGVHKRIEVWQAERFAEHKARLDREKAEQIKEVIATIEGMY